jgi:rubrerythrin
MKNAAQCLGAAARLEIAAQDLYTELSGKFFHEPYLRELFRRLAEEEGQHALRIRMLSRHQGNAPWTPEVLERAVTSLNSAEAALAVLKKELSVPTARLNGVMVLRRVGEVETQFNAIHAEDLSKSLDPKVQQLFTSLAEQDIKHRDLIQAAMTRAVG